MFFCTLNISGGWSGQHKNTNYIFSHFSKTSHVTDVFIYLVLSVILSVVSVVSFRIGGIIGNPIREG